MYIVKEKRELSQRRKLKGVRIMQNMPTATELAIKYAKREQLRIIIDKALNIHADCEYEAFTKLINELKQMLEEA